MFACIKYRNLREHDEVKKKSKRNNNNKPAKYTQYNKNNNNGVYNMKLLPLSLIKVMCARSSTQTSTSSCMMHASAWQRHHQRHAQNFCIQLKRGAGSNFFCCCGVCMVDFALALASFRCCWWFWLHTYIKVYGEYLITN